MSHNNFSSEEINKFSQNHEEWWNTEGKFRTLHDINPTRIDYIESCTSLDHKTVLDIGCGGGIFTTAIAKKNAQVTGIDKAKKAIAAAQQEANKQNLSIEYHSGTLEEFQECNPQKFDLITCLEMLEHVPHPENIIANISKSLVPNGIAVFSTINRSPISYIGGILVAEYMLNLLPRGTHVYNKFIKPAQLCTWLEKANFKIKDITGIHYNPFTCSAKLTKNVAINYLVCAQKNICHNL
ncbi:bifunctional 2-polyprenyl-6-hydroxyphenol methylase/3-demethylubiquinol 3-O-methyltransferase UbiG [Gammaproteobacteria bacterium]|nr:bifunctional 2-polyprenyl-6-hydroxyphenol methylase/3-demethylubiquinol 3-O-methyltransferase UbiG [Gammaproteobacteria bacterium]